MHRVLTAALVLLVSILSSYAQTPSSNNPANRWLRSAEGIGICKVVIQENREIVLFAHEDIFSAVDTVRFTVIPVPVIDEEEKENEILYQWSEDGEIKMYVLPRVTTMDDFNPYSEDSSGLYKYHTNGFIDVQPMNWFHGTSNRIASYERDNGLSPHKPEMVFRMLSVNEDWVRVVVNEHNGTTAFIRIDSVQTIFGTAPGMYFYTWKEYLMGVSRVDFIDGNFSSGKKIPVYNKPNRKRKPLTYPIFNISVVDVAGDMMLIEATGENKDKVAGWVQWRDGNDVKVLLTEYFRY